MSSIQESHGTATAHKSESLLHWSGEVRVDKVRLHRGMKSVVAVVEEGVGQGLGSGLVSLSLSKTARRAVEACGSRGGSVVAGGLHAGDCRRGGSVIAGGLHAGVLGRWRHRPYLCQMGLLRFCFGVIAKEGRGGEEVGVGVAWVLGVGSSGGSAVALTRSRHLPYLRHIGRGLVTGVVVKVVGEGVMVGELEVVVVEEGVVVEELEVVVVEEGVVGDVGVVVEEIEVGIGVGGEAGVRGCCCWP